MNRIAIFAALSFVLTACGPGGEESGALIRPHFSPVNFGNLPLQASADLDPGCGRYAPCSWVLLLQSYGTEPVEVTQTCIVGDTRNAFSVEGPEPATVDPDNDAAVRITYDHDSTSSTVDNIALIVQSSAENFPTLVVPMCGRMIDPADVGSASDFDCETPVNIEEGARDDSLCN
ncbi:MAG: hypothetical protein P1V51_03120 [Deltaproteobacteria bacterium]|nr:hypothetical protein [Deltaproteobacteria bacterium]